LKKINKKSHSIHYLWMLFYLLLFLFANLNVNNNGGRKDGKAIKRREKLRVETKGSKLFDWCGIYFKSISQRLYNKNSVPFIESKITHEI